MLDFYFIQVVLDHFRAVAAAAASSAPCNELPLGTAAPAISRVIIFTTLRDSVQQIVDVLAKHSPLIRPK